MLNSEAMRNLVVLAAIGLALGACNKAAPTPEPAPAPPPPAASAEGVLRLGAPIEGPSENVTLADVAKNPQAFVGKKLTTTGTVTAVCQHMGCWMEIKDESSEAYVKMAGHAFFVPKTASGRKARVLGTLVADETQQGACEDEAEGKVSATGAAPSPAKKSRCREEAENQLGRPLAKIELVAEGVEIL